MGLRVRGAGLEYLLDPTRPAYVLGSDPAVDLVLPDPAVSRYHCVFMWDRGELVVIDKTLSLNGTWVNGVQAHRAVLREGNLIRVGATTLEVFTRPQQARRGRRAPTPRPVHGRAVPIVGRQRHAEGRARGHDAECRCHFLHCRHRS